ncbi:MAG: hypothetical protein IT350_07400 [Deltaproteobacteria bacterium]|nr:hypothetical protein [Deltaproteobacteria bacterium]
MMIDDDDSHGQPRLAERIRDRRPERKPRSPVVMIAVNLALLAFLAVVIRYVIIPDLGREAVSTDAPDGEPDVADLVAIEADFVVIRATGARIPLAPPAGAARIVFVGDWAGALGKPDRDRALDGVSVLMSAVLGGRALDIVALDAPTFSLTDVARLAAFSARLRPSLVALVPAATTPDSPGADVSPALRAALEGLAKKEIPVAVWDHAPNFPEAQAIAIEAGAAYFDEGVLEGADGATREAAAAEWLARNL